MGGPFEICNVLIIITTVVVSCIGFQSRSFEEKYIFEPESILAWKQYYRLVTSGFLHADWQHLAMNMVSLYFFGPMLELFLGKGLFLAVYFGSIIGGSLLSLYVHRHHEYRAYGASGGVCGVIFAYLLMFPGTRLYSFPLPFPIPAWLYALLFIGGSFYCLRTGRDNVGHGAHLGGAIIGFGIVAAAHPSVAEENLKVFLLVLVPSLFVLGYLWYNPLFLPLVAFVGRRVRRGGSAGGLPKYKQDARRMDAILDKVAAEGIHSLTAEERALLEEASEGYRRRGDSKRPESGLAI